MHSLVVWVRKLLAFIQQAAQKFFVTKVHARDFMSQRMCPFCGLITSRSKAFCLECGKSLREVHP